jgi:molybdopterin-guanine dinucleotide biosynthesis adapter protein
VLLRILGIAGWSGSGKTTLIEALLPRLRAAGLRVSTVKHTHHGVALDRPGKDSDRHRAAGAEEVLLIAGGAWALLHADRGIEPDLPGLITRLAPVDLVLVEGFKRSDFPKLEVHRPSLGRPPLWPEDPQIVAVTSDAALPDCDRTVLPLGDADRIATWARDFATAPCTEA